MNSEKMVPNEFGFFPIEDWSENTAVDETALRLCRELDIPELPVPENKDERYLQDDDSSRAFHSTKELAEYFAFRRTHDVIAKAYPGDINVIGVDPGAPLANAMVRKNQNLTENQAPDEMMDVAARDNGLLIVHPNEAGTNYVVHPLMYTGLSGLCARADISGKSILRVVPAKGKRVLGGERRGQIFTECLHLYQSPISLLVRDGKICRMASARYEDLDPADGYYAVRDYLDDIFPGNAFTEGGVSEEYLLVWFDLDADTTDITAKLTAAGAKLDEPVRAYIRYTTSEVRASAMRAICALKINGAMIPIGDPVDETHELGNSVDEFAKKLPKLANVLKEAEDEIEELGNTAVNCVADCVVNLAKELGFKKDTVTLILNRLEAQGKKGAGTAIDVLIALNEAVSVQCSGQHLNVTEYVKLSELTASVMHKNIVSYDHPVDE